MRYLIASDIHGSAYYTQKILDAFENEKADRLILLGDILYHGPRNDLPLQYEPKKVVQLLNQHKDVIYCVKGNCDADIDQMVLEFPIMSSYFLMEINGHLAFFTHGDIFNLKNLPPLKEGSILIHGHTHVQANITENGITYLNPGSVSIPKENSYNGYALLENGTFIFKDFQGNIHDSYTVG